ncbi:hypothetical protein MHK_002561 [Candidatus Magnetomorum sp. HK-1]|nr:hypothetical protein MHK_002561 [Candidatus Magnetomorum sp. HK-1]
MEIQPRFFKASPQSFFLKRNTLFLNSENSDSDNKLC